ncbi:MAG: DUF2520 domain-containing protein [Chloroflexi bacterium]|nr:DUF2520 domain-containing protein [Chloroflexota bacterium]
MDNRPTLGFVGAGKVGSTLARLWFQTGYAVRAISSRNRAKAETLAEQVDARVVATADEVIAAADLILLTVPDDAIEPLAASLQRESLMGKGVIHTSGARDASVLAVLAARGALTGSLHPAFPFADVETAVQRLPGATFALEAESPPLRGWLRDLVLALDGRVMVIPPGQKAVYHSALVIASNYTVTLYAIAERLLTAIGAERDAAEGALNTLVQGTVDNLRETGIPAALTGPLTRADAGTIRRHLQVLRQIDPLVADLYLQLARLSLPMVRARGVSTELLQRVLDQEA